MNNLSQVVEHFSSGGKILSWKDPGRVRHNRQGNHIVEIHVIQPPLIYLKTNKIVLIAVRREIIPYQEI
jgi:hypothetical protein